MTAIALEPTVKPVLLLIPGMLNTAAIWTPVVAHLADLADVRIANVQTQTCIADMARDAFALVADLLPTQRLVVCGFSMGGYIALEMTASTGGQISALALLDTSARAETPEGALVREKTIAAIKRDFPKVVEGILQFGTHPATHSQTAVIDALRQTMLEVGAEAAIRQNRAIVDRADSRKRLTTLNLPTLVACGREDRITPPALSEEIANLIPGARLEWIHQAGHMTPLEQPQQVAELLASLL